MMEGKKTAAFKFNMASMGLPDAGICGHLSRPADQIMALFEQWFYQRPFTFGGSVGAHLSTKGKDSQSKALQEQPAATGKQDQLRHADYASPTFHRHPLESVSYTAAQYSAQQANDPALKDIKQAAISKSQVAAFKFGKDTAKLHEPSLAATQPSTKYGESQAATGKRDQLRHADYALPTFHKQPPELVSYTAAQYSAQQANDPALKDIKQAASRKSQAAAFKFGKVTEKLHKPSPVATPPSTKFGESQAATGKQDQLLHADSALPTFHKHPVESVSYTVAQYSAKEASDPALKDIKQGATRKSQVAAFGKITEKLNEPSPAATRPSTKYNESQEATGKQDQLRHADYLLPTFHKHPLESVSYTAVQYSAQQANNPALKDIKQAATSKSQVAAFGKVTEKLHEPSRAATRPLTKYGESQAAHAVARHAAIEVLPAQAPGANRVPLNALKASDSCKVHEATAGSPSCVVHAQHLRSKGNKAFGTQDWKQSVQLYTHAISVLLAASSEYPTSNSAFYALQSSRSEVREELALVYSNRAEARIHLKHFEKAVLDAHKALELQPGHVKSMFRIGRALQCLNQYNSAVLCFEEALDLDPSNEELREALEASKQCQKQATTGEYDLPRMRKEVDEGRVPVCAEFIGDVTLGAARDKAMGPGLLVTRDLTCGELLLVSKAVAEFKMDPRDMEFHGKSVTEGQVNTRRIWSSSYHEDLVIQVVERARVSDRFRQQIYSLALDGVTAAEVKNIPSMALFFPKESEVIESIMATADDDLSCQDSIDVDKIRGVVRTNAIELTGSLRAMLWLTPSFINRSCMPNASWITVGEALFVHAARNLKKGEEVTISYLDSHALQAEAPTANQLRVKVPQHALKGDSCKVHEATSGCPSCVGCAQHLRSQVAAVHEPSPVAARPLTKEGKSQAGRAVAQYVAIEALPADAPTANQVRLEVPLHALKAGDSRKVHEAAAGSPSCVVQAQHLKSKGNKAFGTQDWKQSVQLYTHAISVLLAAFSECPASSSAANAVHGSGLEVREELALVYSNRAEARIRLKHFEKAVLDAHKALELQPGHVKSMSRIGRALQCLNQYNSAVLCFKEALDLDPSNEELREALEASKQCQKQATTGEYDLPQMCKEVDEGRVPVCAEFIRDVVIGAASDKAMGRGLLVTRDVMCGELLLVSKSVAESKMDPKAMGFHGESVTEGQRNMRRFRSCFYHEDVVIQLVERARASDRFRQQIYSLASDSITAPNVENIPSMDLFFPKESKVMESIMAAANDDSPCHDSIDVDKIRGVVRTNAFELPGSLHAMLWLTPSFINHSCVPNTSWMTVGNSIFVRAARNLKKGEELTISYLDSLLPYALRAENIQKFRGFQCMCERCAFEKTVERSIRHIVAGFSYDVQRRLGQNDEMRNEGAARVARDLEWALGHWSSDISDKQKQWLRTSFAQAYVRTHKDTFPLASDGLPSLEEVVGSVQDTLGCAELVVILLRTVWFGPHSSPRLKESLASMCVCLYGRQQPAALHAFLARRKSLLMKSLLWPL